MITLFTTLIEEMMNSFDYNMPIVIVIFMEAFVSIHMSLFVLMPIAKAVNPADYKKTFWKLFAINEL